MNSPSRYVSRSLLAAGLLSMITLAVRPSVGWEDDAKEEVAQPVYELRTYTTAPGRLPALHRRFADHTMRLFEKHGMRNVIYWTPAEQENTLVYVLAHQSRESAAKSWDAFRNDPEWKKVFAESRKDGPIVTKVISQFLTPTAYSPQLNLHGN